MNHCSHLETRPFARETTAFITDEGAKVCFVYFLLEGISASREKNCRFFVVVVVLLLIHALFCGSVVTQWASEG